MEILVFGIFMLIVIQMFHFLDWLWETITSPFRWLWREGSWFLIKFGLRKPPPASKPTPGFFGWIVAALKWLAIAAAVILVVAVIAGFFSSRSGEHEDAGSSGGRRDGARDNARSTGGTRDGAHTGTGSSGGARDGAGSSGASGDGEPPPRSPDRAWALKEMGLPASASKDEIKARFHELVKKYHPDRLAPDATARERENAQKRMERINLAYEILKR